MKGKMTEGDIDVIVSAPDEKIVASGGRVSLQNIFLQRMFEIAIHQDEKSVSFDVNLPEWLEALTKFLRQTNESTAQLQLVLSGERFEARRLDGGLQIRVFDRKSSMSTWLTLSHAQARQFHAKLVAELCAAVDRSAGHHLEILDLDRVRLS